MNGICPQEPHEFNDVHDEDVLKVSAVLLQVFDELDFLAHFHGNYQPERLTTTDDCSAGYFVAEIPEH